MWPCPFAPAAPAGATPRKGGALRAVHYQTAAANQTFLPAAGYRNGSSLNNAGSNGNYWSSSYNENNTNNARNLNFNSGNHNTNNNNRYYGFSVRAVCP